MCKSLIHEMNIVLLIITFEPVLKIFYIFIIISNWNKHMNIDENLSIYIYIYRNLKLYKYSNIKWEYNNLIQLMKQTNQNSCAKGLRH